MRVENTLACVVAVWEKERESAGKSGILLARDNGKV